MLDCMQNRDQQALVLEDVVTNCHKGPVGCAGYQDGKTAPILCCDLAA